MRPINEKRILATFKYIEDYYALHNACPTYRQIKDECGYSTLSLVPSDIDKLKERGLIIDDAFKRITLVEQKAKSQIRYDYPFLLMTDAFLKQERLNEEEKLLLEAQDNYLKGNYQLANEQALSLIKTSKDQSVNFGARLTLCCAAIYTGNTEPWTTYFKMMITYQSKSISEKMEKELIAHFLTSTLGSRENCPEWLKEGRFYNLRTESIPLAMLLFLAQAIKADPPISPYYLEPLCSSAAINHIEVCQMYMNLYLAVAYHYSGNDKYLDEHLRYAVNICVEHGWLTPLAELKKTLGSVLYPIIEDIDESLIKKVDELHKTLMEGYDKIHQAFVGDNPLKDLTFREVEVINYIRMDFSTKEIASQLYLSTETIKYYLSSIYSKLNISGRAELKRMLRKYL